MSKADVAFVAQLAASSLSVAGYAPDSGYGKAVAALREMLGDESIGCMVELFCEVKRARSQHVLSGVMPFHALVQEALQEIGS